MRLGHPRLQRVYGQGSTGQDSALSWRDPLRGGQLWAPAFLSAPVAGPTMGAHFGASPAQPAWCKHSPLYGWAH